MQIERVANITLVLMAALSFLIVIVNPAVSLSDFSVSFEGYLFVCIILWSMAAFAMICVRLIWDILRGQTENRFGFLADWFRYHLKHKFLTILLPFWSFLVLKSSFSVSKSIVIPDAGYTWDATFAAWDAWLFAGNDPWELTHWVFSSPQASLIIDKLYHDFFYPMLVVYALCSLMTRGPFARACYLATYLACWLVIGCIMAPLLASAGPTFEGFVHQGTGQFSALVARLAEQSDQVGGLDAYLLRDFLLNNYTNGQAGVGGGISAMPSMHISLALMWALLFFHINKWLGWATVVYTLIIWMGSVHLAWHYAWDGIISGAVTLVLWVGFLQLFSRTVRTENTEESLAPENTAAAAE